MRSSESTPSRSRSGGPRLLLWIVGEDHPRACTGRRLVERGLVERVGAGEPVRRGILLDPYAPTALSMRDRPFVDQSALLAVDCSWNRLSSRGAFPSGPVDAVPPRRRRRLPILLAGNSHHFGHVGELNTAEAFAGALATIGYRDAAERLLASFRDGGAFFSINERAIEAYGRADTSDAILAAERALFGGA